MAKVMAMNSQGHSPVGLERCSHIAEVIGSSPIVPTTNKNPINHFGWWDFCCLYILYVCAVYAIIGSSKKGFLCWNPF